MSFIEFKHIGKKYAGADKNSVSDFNGTFDRTRRDRQRACRLCTGKD